MPTPLRLDGLLAKEESTYGTDPTPTVGDDGVRISDRVWNQLTPEYAFPNRRDDVASGSLIPVRPAARTGRIVTLEFGVEAKGAGSAYSSSTPVRPEMDPLFIACARSRTHDDTVSAEKVDYDPADTGHGSATIWAYAGGKLFKVVGCRGNCVLEVNGGQIPIFRFTMQGMLLVDPTEVALPAITYDAQVPPAAVSVSLSIGTGPWSPRFTSFRYDFGNQVQRLDSGNAADGVDGFHISRIEPTIQLSAEADALSDYDPYTTSQDVTAGEDVDLTLGDTQYNRVKLDVNTGAWLETPAHAEDNEFAAWDLTYQLTDDTVTFD